jgi:carboxyl-terminal processing protease
MSFFQKNRKWTGLALGAMTAASVLWFSWGRVKAAGDTYYAQLELFSYVVNLVKNYYVDEVDPKKLMEGAISGMLEQLDPHSAYLPKQRYTRFTEDFRGNYSGIGIEFEIRDKWITVISPIEGSPSYRLGLRPGDRITKIDDKPAFDLTTEDVYSRLRGPDGSKVHLTLERLGVDEDIQVDIIRERIPLYSVPYHFMVNPETGYVRIVRFANTTSDELEKALVDLEQKGMKQLILDLRANGGGLLNQASDVVEKFVPAGEKIVYTRGRSRDYYSGEGTKHLHFPMVVLVDHGSASASEITSGALQDLDRALVVGLPTFGKGLVQNQVRLPDSSAILLTIAHYYTPSGRLIQRDYSDRQAYLRAAIEDSVIPADSILAKRPKFKTNSGRTVYGGGGITPDEFDPYPPRFSRLMVAMVGQREFFEYASKWVPKHPEAIDKAHPAQFVASYQVSPEMLADYQAFVKTKKITFTPEEWQADLPNITNYLKAELAGVAWDRNTFMQVLMDRDTQFQKAMTYFPEARLLLQKFAAHYSIKTDK